MMNWPPPPSAVAADTVAPRATPSTYIVVTPAERTTVTLCQSVTFANAVDPPNDGVELHPFMYWPLTEPPDCTAWTLLSLPEQYRPLPHRTPEPVVDDGRTH